jgi:transposase
MPSKRIPMRKIKEVLRLHFEAGLGHRKIAQALNISKGAVNKYLSLARANGLSWPLPEDLDEEKLEQCVFSRAPKPFHQLVKPDHAAIHQELKRKGVTLQLLWSEYASIHGENAYHYSRYCDLYRDWAGKQKRSMRQRHRAGERLFIDYCGPTVEVIDPSTGEVCKAQVFVAVLGASNYTYAEATWSQGLPDWIASHQRAFRFLGGVPELLVPDNLRSAVKKACRYAPEPNDTYLELARHYGTAIVPARPYKPKDKAKAEAAVLLVERWILARLRHRTFFSLQELNEAIRELLEELNARPFQKLPGCRKSAFETLDRPALKALPAMPYDYAEWKRAKVGFDYHVEVNKHFYSVPHTLIGEQLDVRIGGAVVEIFRKGKRVAAHPRTHTGGFSTLSEHMPKSHRKHMEWSPGRFLNWAKDIGPCTLNVVKQQLRERPHTEHGYRACLGLLNQANRYSRPRLEAACKRALTIGSPTYRSIASILKKGLDRQNPNDTNQLVQEKLPLHGNVRGSRYYC